MFGEPNLRDEIIEFIFWVVVLFSFVSLVGF